MVDTERRGTEGVAEVVQKILMEPFDDPHPISVQVGESYDAGGDPVLDIVVVYESDDRELDISKVVSFVRQQRPALSEIGEERFPMMSYVPADEYAESA